jgi:hypothetical protein
MYRPTGRPWTLPELQDLFADYFGNKLSSVQIERLAQDCASALERKTGDLATRVEAAQAARPSTSAST